MQKFEAPIPPRFAVRAALALRSKLLKLADRVVPPQARIIELAYGYQSTMLLRVAASLKVADLLATGPKTADELARRGGVDADALHRTLRALATYGVFEL